MSSSKNFRVRLSRHCSKIADVSLFGNITSVFGLAFHITGITVLTDISGWCQKIS